MSQLCVLGTASSNDDQAQSTHIVLLEVEGNCLAHLREALDSLLIISCGSSMWTDRMATSKAFSSSDGRAIVVWRRGIILDQITLAVDGVIVAEKSWGGLSWPIPDYLILDGFGYRASIRLGFTGFLGATDVISCEIREPKRKRDTQRSERATDQQDSEPRYDDTKHSARNDGGKSRRANARSLTVKEALIELGFAESRVHWTSIEARFKTLVKQYHPDNYASLDLPPEMVHAAEEKFRQIKAAYDILRRARESKRQK